jgi:hypothetical protein
MDVLKQTSPSTSPLEPNETPANTVPSSRANFAVVGMLELEGYGNLENE